MKPSLLVRLLVFLWLAGVLATSSVTVAPPVVATALAPSVTLPWAMSGCWEHDLFIPKATATVAQQTAPQK